MVPRDLVSANGLVATSGRLERRLARLDRTRFDWSDAARAVAVLAIPIALGVSTDLVAAGVFAAIGGLNVLLLQATGDARQRLLRSGYGWGLNTAMIAAGTLVGTLGWVEVPLVAVALTFVHLANRIPGSGSLSVTASVVFAIGVGLPGASVAAAGMRAELVFLGGGLAVVGLAAHCALLRSWARTLPADPPNAPGGAAPAPGALPEWPHALAVGLTAAGGLALALSLGLARDYWVMLTVVVVLRARFDDTLETGAGRMVGTVLGAALGAVVTITVAAFTVQGALLLAFVFAAFALQRANAVLYAVALTAFVIVLLNLVYPGGVLLAETRVLDTFIGGSLAMIASALLWYLRYRPSGPGSAPLFPIDGTGDRGPETPAPHR